jgi:hypothetical protein
METITGTTLTPKVLLAEQQKGYSKKVLVEGITKTDKKIISRIIQRDKQIKFEQSKYSIKTRRKIRLAYKKKNRLIKALLTERNQLIEKLQEVA